jgi:hypothetical protein
MDHVAKSAFAIMAIGLLAHAVEQASSITTSVAWYRTLCRLALLFLLVIAIDSMRTYAPATILLLVGAPVSYGLGLWMSRAARLRSGMDSRKRT